MHRICFPQVLSSSQHLTLSSANLVLGRVTSLLEDESSNTRFFMMKLLSQISTICNVSVTWENVLKIFPVLSSRLDDVDSSVRIETVHCLTNMMLFLVPPEKVLHVEVREMLLALLHHMDDQDEIVRRETLNCLKKLGAKYQHWAA